MLHEHLGISGSSYPDTQPLHPIGPFTTESILMIRFWWSLLFDKPPIPYSPILRYMKFILKPPIPRKFFYPWTAYCRVPRNLVFFLTACPEILPNSLCWDRLLVRNHFNPVPPIPRPPYPEILLLSSTTYPETALSRDITLILPRDRLNPKHAFIPRSPILS